MFPSLRSTHCACSRTMPVASKLSNHQHPHHRRSLRTKFAPPPRPFKIRTPTRSSTFLRIPLLQENLQPVDSVWLFGHSATSTSPSVFPPRQQLLNAASVSVSQRSSF